MHGRGAQSARVPSRFGLATREADGDWLDEREAQDGAPPKLRTTVTEEFPRTVLSFNRSPDIPFDRSVNAYRGCEQFYTVAMCSFRISLGGHLPFRFSRTADRIADPNRYPPIAPMVDAGRPTNNKSSPLVDRRSSG